MEFDAEDKKLEEILTGREKYKIPRYQRPYSWGSSEVEELWEDMEERTLAFIGSFVFNYEKTEETGFVEIIDGQQRLITFTILMAALRDLYKKVQAEDGSIQNLADLTQTTAIAHRNNIDGSDSYRIECGDSLNTFFSRYIQNKDADIASAKTDRKEFKLIKDNYNFFYSKIDAELSAIKETANKIIRLNNIKKNIFNFKVILIKIGSEDDAYSIFETVNARGAELTNSDLLKNYFLGEIKESEGLDSAKDSWSEIERNVETAKGLLNISKFIRYYWLSKGHFVSERKLFKEIKKSTEDPRSFLEELKQASSCYAKISARPGAEDDWSEYIEDKQESNKIRDSIAALRTMKITQCYPLLFCLLLNRKKINFDISSIVSDIEKFHFAYSAICALPGNKVERLYFNTAKDIHAALLETVEKKRNKSLQRAISNFKTKLPYPAKNIFLESFINVEYSDYPIVIYILSKIEEKTGSGEIQVNLTKTNIEHILPQDPSLWGLKKDSIKSYVNKLGNLTLISSKINGKMENKTLADKMADFSASELKINKELIEKFKALQMKWDEKAISKRQEELAETAYETVWKFK